MKIAIASGKGGTGKTSLSTNLAAYLAEEINIVLADLDVEEPNSGLFIRGNLVNSEDKFKMIPEWVEDKCTLCGLCQKVCNFHAVLQLGPQILVFPELCHSCYACSELCTEDALPMKEMKMGELKHFESGNLSFIESRLEIGQEQAVPLIAQTIEYVEENFDSNTLMIFDSPPGTSCPVIESVKDADFVILVTEPTAFGLHDLSLAVDTINELKKPHAVVINRYGIGNDDVIDFCMENNIPIWAKIPNMRKIAEIYSEGNLFYDKVPEFMTELEKVKANIMTLKEEAE